MPEIRAKYAEGQRVRILPLIDTCGRPDARLQPYVGKVGTVMKVYCVSHEELREKTWDIPDVYCCHVRLDEGDFVVPGVPEVALVLHVFG
jgi:hypothetical protein